MCSEDDPRAPKWFKYLACPNEPECGDQDIYPGYDEVVIREIEQYTDYYFVKNDICSFIVHAPPEMQANDSMKIKISNIVFAVVIVHKSPAGKHMHFSHLDRVLDPNH